MNKEAKITLPSIDIQGGQFTDGELFTALGWGLDKTGGYPNSLQMADRLVYVKHDQCKGFLGDAVKKHSICAGFGNQNACKGVMLVSGTFCQAFSAEGDSGGPLLIPNRFRGNTAAGNPELDLIVGITSLGFENCNDASPSIYTSIGAFWDWIREKIDEDPKVTGRFAPFPTRV